MSTLETAQFRASTGNIQGFGATPLEALTALMTLMEGDPTAPIVIWPYNKGDAFFTTSQQERLQELKARRQFLSLAEQEELTALVEAAFEATIPRTQMTQNVKS